MKKNKKNVIKAYKGFNKNLQCLGFQYEIGKEYEEPTAKCCNSGFHACECPLDCFNYYDPANSRFCEVEQSGEIDRTGSDTKVASTKIKIGAELDFGGLIKASINYIKERATKKTKGANKRANYSVASNSGYKSVASNTGYKSVASNTGDNSVASNSGYKSVASNTGDNSVASVENDESVACSLGVESKAKGKLGCWLVLSEWQLSEDDYKYHRIDTQCVKVDGEKIKADTLYKLENGKFVECDND